MGMVLNVLNRSDKYLTYLSFFPTDLYNGELTKLTWPQVTDMKKNMRYTSCRYILSSIPKSWKFQIFISTTVAVTPLESFSEVGSLDLTWWLDLRWPGPKICMKVAEQLSKQLWKNGGAAGFELSAKTWGGGGVKPSLAWRGMMD